MTPKQIELIEQSWDFVLLNSSEVGMHFYDLLFQLDPNLRPLFKQDIKSQSQKLVSLITFAVRKINNLNSILADVEALGVRHKNYNVKSEHYATVAAALLRTLEKCMGNKWNGELKQAWVELYTTLSKIMIDATKRPMQVL